MARSTVRPKIFLLLVFVTFLGLNGVGTLAQGDQNKSDCSPSELGYECMKTLSDFFRVHWTVGGQNSRRKLLQGEAAAPEEGQIAFALEGETDGYVGLGLAEVAGNMSPADVVLGWVESDGTLDVRPYRTTVRSIAFDDENEDVKLIDVGGSEIDGKTIVWYTLTTGEGTVPVPLDEPIPVNFAIGPTDGLQIHMFNERGSSSILLGAAKDSEEKEPEAPAKKPRKPKKPAAAPQNSPVEAETVVDADTPEPEAPEISKPTQQKGCATPSDLEGYECMSVLSNLVTVHWLVGPVDDRAREKGDIYPLPEEGEIAMAVVGQTEGWVAVAFPDKAGVMDPADTVLGWVSSDGYDVKPYKVTSKRITPDDVDPNVELKQVKGKEANGVTTIEFVQKSPVNITNGDINVNWAVGDADSLRQHAISQRGSSNINLLTGSFDDTTVSLEKYYKWHGALMIVAWMGFVSVGILVARNRCWINSKSESLWFELHRGLQLMGLAAMIAAFVIALTKFEESTFSRAKAHRIMGYVVFGATGLQILAGIFRPGKEHPRRHVFTILHSIFGQIVHSLASTTIFYGIFTYEDLLEVDVKAWWIPVTAALGVYVILSIMGAMCRPKQKTVERQPRPEQGAPRVGANQRENV